MNEFTHKLVAFINKSLEKGKAMNALAHMSLGLGSSIENKKSLRLDTYIDANDNHYNNISDMPFIILEASGNKIKDLYHVTKKLNVQYTTFTNTMTIGTYKEQQEKTRATKEEDLIFYGITIFGEWNIVSEITKKFSLLK